MINVPYLMMMACGHSESFWSFLSPAFMGGGDCKAAFYAQWPFSRLIFLICITMLPDVNARQFRAETTKLPEISNANEKK